VYPILTAGRVFSMKNQEKNCARMVNAWKIPNKNVVKRSVLIAGRKIVFTAKSARQNTRTKRVNPFNFPTTNATIVK
jgi:hypothetical protein